ncbi:hypothetical protein, partial [Pseudomonas sp. 2822-17]|uniref:hypothetical protein n=1 Tax=Pseudomonas sp. 2822-17 TaxID=1712678 RepID=UPI001C447F75
MLFSKWTIYQCLTVVSLLVIFFLAEINAGSVNITVSSEQITPFNNGITYFLFVGIILGCFYLLFLFEAKKGSNFFSRSVWGKMPWITFTLGIVSLILFMLSALLGPLFQWVEQWRYLIYIFFSYFLLILFVFTFSLVY